MYTFKQKQLDDRAFSESDPNPRTPVAAWCKEKERNITCCDNVNTQGTLTYAVMTATAAWVSMKNSNTSQDKCKRVLR